MGSLPPPVASKRVYAPDDAPFLRPGRRRSRLALWTLLTITGVAAVVLGIVLFADRVGDGTDRVSASATTLASTSSAVAAGAGESTVATTVAPTVDSVESAPPVALVPPVTPVPGVDLSGLVVTNVLVSPGKDGGYPIEGAVPPLPGVTPTFPASTPYVCIFWNARGMPNGVPNGIVWTRDGQLVRTLEETTFVWDAGSTVRPNWCVPSRPSSLEPGLHRVEYFVAGVSQFVVEFRIG
jgi:hypothetical protein